jgi:hypothetical protein
MLGEERKDAARAAKGQQDQGAHEATRQQALQPAA